MANKQTDNSRQPIHQYQKERLLEPFTDLLLGSPVILESPVRWFLEYKNLQEPNEICWFDETSA